MDGGSEHDEQDDERDCQCCAQCKLLDTEKCKVADEHDEHAEVDLIENLQSTATSLSLNRIIFKAGCLQRI